MFGDLGTCVKGKLDDRRRMRFATDVNNHFGSNLSVFGIDVSHRE